MASPTATLYNMRADFNMLLNRNKASFDLRKQRVHRFRREMMKIAKGLEKESKTPEAKAAYKKIIGTLENTVIVGIPGDALKKAGNVATMGEHVKEIKVRKNGYIKTIERGKEVIYVPQRHLFYDDRITPRGALTLTHEIVHGAISNELLTDLVMVRFAARGGIPKNAVLSHLAGRGVVYGRKGVQRAYSLAESAYKKSEKRVAEWRRRRPVRKLIRPRQRPAYAR